MKQIPLNLLIKAVLMASIDGNTEKWQALMVLYREKAMLESALEDYEFAKRVEKMGRIKRWLNRKKIKQVQRVTYLGLCNYFDRTTNHNFFVGILQTPVLLMVAESTFYKNPFYKNKLLEGGNFGLPPESYSLESTY